MTRPVRKPVAHGPYQRMEAFFRHHRHLAFSPHRDTSLYQWAVEQRQLWKLRMLPPAREARLRELDFPFEPEAVEWEQDLARLLALLGQGRAPRAGGVLGRWLAAQQGLARTGDLRPTRLRRLRSLRLL